MAVNPRSDEMLEEQAVRQALTDWLGPRGLVEVSRDEPEGRITGWIMHPSFAGVDNATRQDWIWQGLPQPGSLPMWSGLRGRFGDKAAQIGMIFTFSPFEYESAFGE